MSSKLRLLLCLSLVTPLAAFGQAHRFTEDQITFELRDNEGAIEKCHHKLLPQVPWWSVQCGDRRYTVNTWIQISHQKDLQMTKVSLMYDVSEGLSSSGEKIVQFHSHFSNIYVDSLTSLRLINSDMDVRNGQMSLVMTGKLN